MTAMSGPLVHQMLWRASERNLVGIAGFGPVASSLPEEVLEQWWMALRAKLNAAPPETREAGRAGDDFSYLVLRVGDREHAVVVRKRPVEDDLGRAGSSRAHVLIGPPHDISPPVALGLTAYDWQGWLGAGGALPEGGGSGGALAIPGQAADTGYGGSDAAVGAWLPPLALSEVRVAGLKAYNRVRDIRDRSWPQEVFADLLLRTLCAPELASRAAPAGPETLSLLCALYDVLGDTVDGPWTFATREPPGHRETAWLVFATGGPIPQPSPAAQNPWLDGFARALAQLYCDKGMGGVERYISAAKKVRSGAEAIEWAHACSSRPGVLRDDLALLRHAMAGKLTDSERAYLREPAAEAEVRASVSKLRAEQFATLLDGWAPAVMAANPAAREEYNIAVLVLNTALASADRTVLNAVTRLAQRSRDTVYSVLVGGFAETVDRMALHDRGRRARPDWAAWRRLAAHAADFDALVDRGTTRSAFMRMPAYALLAYIAHVVVNRAAGQYPAARIAWEAVVRRRQDSDDRALVREVLVEQRLLEHLDRCVHMLSEEDLRADERLKISARFLVYRQMLLNPSIGSTLMRRRARLLRRLLADSPGRDDAFVVAVYEQQRLPGRVRAALSRILAGRYRDYLISSPNRS